MTKARLRLVQMPHDAIKTRDVAQAENTLRLDSRGARTYRLGVRREQHEVVYFVVFITGIEIAHAHIHAKSICISQKLEYGDMTKEQ